jgi:SAM-dependent methyltransferase
MVDYSETILRRRRSRVRSVLDLACGTGSAAIEFARRGYDCTGLDVSEGMLKIARRKARAAGQPMRFLHCDMTSFKLSQPVDMITCFFDSVNHILEKDEIRQTFRCVHNALKPGGLFIFDINTLRALRCWARFTTVREASAVYSVWQGSFDKSRQLAAIGMTFFRRQRDGSYVRSSTEIPERGFKLNEWAAMLRSAGFGRPEAYKCFSFEKPDRTTHRVCFVCRRQ